MANRKCGLWGHSYKKYGRRHEGKQQFRCRKCGRVKNGKARPCFMGMHSWRKDRRAKNAHVLMCKRCGKRKRIGTEADRHKRGNFNG